MSTPLLYRDLLIDRYRLVYDWVPEGIDRLLDFGCGNGVFTQWFLHKAKRVSALDHNPQQLEFAKREFPRLETVQGKGGTLPFEDCVFEVVVMSDVLEHVDDDRVTAAEIIRVLKPGGRVVVTVPNRGPLQWLDGDNLVNRFVWLLSKLRIPKPGRADGRWHTFYEGFEYKPHRHYGLSQIEDLFGGACQTEQIHYGGVLFWPLEYVFEKSVEVFLKRDLVSRRYTLLRRLRALDFKLGIGRWSYNLGVCLRKRGG